jgi:hypothetical protein
LPLIPLEELVDALGLFVQLLETLERLQGYPVVVARQDPPVNLRGKLHFEHVHETLRRPGELLRRRAERGRLYAVEDLGSRLLTHQRCKPLRDRGQNPPAPENGGEVDVEIVPPRHVAVACKRHQPVL